MSTLNASISTQVIAEVTGLNDLSNADSKVALSNSTKFTPGAGAGQANYCFASSRTLAASASETLNLVSGLNDPNNVPLVFGGIKAIYVKANANNTNDVIVGGAATTTFVGPFGSATATIAVRPGSELLLYDHNSTGGWPVTGSTNSLKVANGGAGTSVAYQIIILGI
jgi:hypothetical protein